MKFVIEKFLNKHDKGLFLLDSPTGFGKTFAVKKILKEFLSGKKHQHIDKMFFITNLKSNLPYEELLPELSQQEIDQCVRIRAVDEDLIINWSKATNIIPEQVKASKEFKALKSDIEILSDLEREKEELLETGKPIFNKQRGIDGFSKKIATITEPTFREFIKQNFFSGKSVVEKKEFIKENEWISILYPITKMEEKKVVFMTTAKFFSPISVFYRMPFFSYDDKLIDNSVVFIDEFDTTKQTVLNQIIEHCLEINIDIISLFTNIHYVLQNRNFPQRLKQMAKIKEDDNSGGEGDVKYLASEDILEQNKGKFKDIYDKHNFDLLLRSSGFDNKRAFLFDDGNFVTVYNDTSKKHLMVKDDREVNYLKIVAEKYDSQKLSLNNLLGDVQSCIRFFARGLEFLSKNYFYFLNTDNDGKFNYKYSYDEALMTILSAFNLNGENRNYLQNMLTDGRYNIDKNEKLTRKGFRFTEIEDSNYHELQSVAKQFNFETTPENLIALIAMKARLVGISATATVPTIIGNYDLEYLRKVLEDSFSDADADDRKVIENNFMKTQEIYDEHKIKINVSLVDDLGAFSNKDKARELIKKIYKGEIKDKYLARLEVSDEYYFLILIKLTYLYCEVDLKNIKSFIAFLNRHPKPGDKLDLNDLSEMLKDAAVCNGFDEYKYFIAQSENYDEVFDNVYTELALGKKCFVISVYQTIGSGKNIQYPIPDVVKDDVVIVDSERFEKDFDGIYLITPTNLTQQLYIDSENKNADLARYLYQQQSLYLSKKITNGQYRQNIVNGFRKMFFLDRYVPSYNKNSDMNCHTAQLIIQAIGRICRCRNKNKEIHIYADTEVTDRIQNAKPLLGERVFNREFLELLGKEMAFKKIETVQDFSIKNKKASLTIKNNAYLVRSSRTRVNEWIELRDFVLKNPTTNNVPDRYQDLYFRFDSTSNGYSYKPDNRFNIIDLKLDTRNDMIQVSEQDCELPIITSPSMISEFFKEMKYVTKWRWEQNIMTPALYNQVYKAALGEVVGRKILEDYILGNNLEELGDYSLYELFDFKYGDIYFDFKHWKLFQKDPIEAITSIKRKLKKVNGSKCFIINIVRRGNHKPNIFQDETVIQIPYLIDPTTNEICKEMADKILEFIDK